MKIGIHKFPQTPGLEQIGTIWHAYTTNTSTDDLLNIRKDKPDEIYEIEVNIVIPLGSTYYFKADRILRAIDDDGEPVKDADGNDIISIQTTEERTPIFNEDTLRENVVFDTPAPLQPILRQRKDLDVITIESSNISPSLLTLDKVYWAVVSNGNVVYATVKEDDNLLKFTIPKRLLDKYRDLQVTAIHYSDGVVSEIGKTYVMSNRNIEMKSNLNKISAHVDAYIHFSVVSDIQQSDIVKVELIPDLGNEKLVTLDVSYNNTIHIDKSLLLSDSSYTLRFFIKDTGRNYLTEDFTITTLPELVNLFTNPLYDYYNEITLQSSSTVKRLNKSMQFKTRDGRVLITTEDGKLGWGVINEGVVTKVSSIDVDTDVIDIDVNEHYKVLTIRDNYFILAFKQVDGPEKIAFLRDLGPIESLEIIQVMNASGLSIPSITIDPLTGYLVYNSTNGFKKIDLKDNKFLTGLAPEDVLDVAPRPDGITDNTIFLPIKGRLLVIGGDSASSYFIDLRDDSYLFAKAIPSNLVNKPISGIRLINNDVILFPISETGRNKISIYKDRTSTFTEDTEVYFNNIRGWIISGGVRNLIDGNNFMGYYQ